MHGKEKAAVPTPRGLQLGQAGFNGTTQLMLGVFYTREALCSITRPRNEMGGPSGKVLIPGSHRTPRGNVTSTDDHENGAPGVPPSSGILTNPSPSAPWKRYSTIKNPAFSRSPLQSQDPQWGCM